MNKRSSAAADKQNAAIARFYDERAGWWSDVYRRLWDSFDRYEVVHRKSLVLGLVTERTGRASRIVEIGCGSGALMIDLLSRGHHVAGLDISEGMVQAARQAIEDGQYGGRADCVVGDSADLPYEAESFDGAVCVGTLSHMPAPEPTVAELSRVVVDGGFVVATVANALKLRHLLDPYTIIAVVSRLGRRMSPWSRGPEPGLRQSVKSDDFMLRNYHFGELGALLEHDGLTIREILPCTFGPLTFWGKEVLPLRMSVRLSTSLERLAGRKGFGFLRFFANFWVILLDKSEPDI